jgi:hypothetical protein
LEYYFLTVCCEEDHEVRQRHDLFDGLAVMAFLNVELKDHQHAIKSVYGRLLRESAEWSDDGFHEELRSRGAELVAAVKRLDYSPTESWFYGSKAKGQPPDRSEFLKRVPPAKTPLSSTKHDAGTVHYDLSVLDPKCDRFLVVQRRDSPWIERLDRSVLVLKSSRGKTPWRIFYRHTWKGRSTVMQTEKPLETLIGEYSIVAMNGTREAFTSRQLDERERKSMTRAIEEGLSFDESWMGGVSDKQDWHPAPAPSAVGMASAGDKRQALGKWRSGQGAGPNGGNDFVESVGSVAHERNDVAKRSGQEFKTRVNIKRRLGEEN